MSSANPDFVPPRVDLAWTGKMILNDPLEKEDNTTKQSMHIVPLT